MRCRTRDGILTEKDGGQDRILRGLYTNAAGRALLKLLISPPLSRTAGWALSTKASKVLIKSFIRKNGIDMSQFQPGPYESYNDFFCRPIRPELRPVDMDPQHLISPCDSKLTALPIGPDARFVLKDTPYTLDSLLRDPGLAARFEGGWALIFRLCVEDYHRYCYIDGGSKEANIFLPGVLHTVNPIANDVYPIYKENSREYTLIHSDSFGDLVQMEVGALLVGRIVNHHAQAQVSRGQEKGYFQFGGSTVVVLLEKGRVEIDPDILKNSAENIETVVRMGEKIGIRN